MIMDASTATVILGAGLGGMLALQGWTLATVVALKAEMAALKAICPHCRHEHEN